MEGSLSGFSLPEVLEILAVKKKTGLLTIDAPPAGQGRLWLKDGQFCLAETSTMPSLTGRNAKSEQIEETIGDTLLEILNWGDGVYCFKAGDESEAGGAVLLDVGKALTDVAKRQAEWDEIKKEIPSLKAKVELIADIAADIIDLTKHEWLLVALIGRSATIEELQKKLHLSPLAVCRVLFAMSKKGLIRCLGEVIESEPPAAVLEPEAKALSKKYIRRSLLADEEVDSLVPAEWASYYQLLDSRKVAAKTQPAARAAEH